MSDAAPNTASPPVDAGAAGGEQKKQEAERVLNELLGLMTLPARVELKDAADGGLSAAVFLEAELPGVATGKRSPVVDALQFLTNKLVNRPSAPPKRWVSIGIGGHPAPKAPPAPRPVPVASPPPPAKPARAAPAPRAAVAPNESELEVAPDAQLSQLAELLLTRSGKLGRFYGLATMKPEDRARMFQAAQKVQGAAARVKLEGEGRARRLVFVPDNPVPMPKKTLPAYDDEDDVE